MTQILTRASRHYVMQVSDRLVTKDASRFDPLSNKSLILATINGVVALSYTGQAFVDGVPTDQWIAEVLRGQRFDRSRKPPAAAFGRCLSMPDLGRNLERARKAITDVRLTGDVTLQQLGGWYREPFEISFAGWQWYRKGRSRPIIGTIVKPAWSLNASLEYSARSELACGKVVFSVAPFGHAGREEWATLYKKLGGLSPQETERVFVSQIRQLATTTSVVGSDCLSIFMPRPVWGPIFVRFLPLRTAWADVVGKEGRAVIQVAYSPWILNADACYAPSAISGDTCIHLGAFAVIMRCPSSGISVFASQQRPRDPQL